MAPLIDIVFLLLVFFVFTAGMVNEPMGVDVHLPGASTATAQEAVPLVVFASADGQLYVDQEPVTLADLASAIRQRSGEAGGTALTIFADQKVDFQRILSIMDAARTVGIRDIDFAVREEDTPVFDRP